MTKSSTVWLCIAAAALYGGSACAGSCEFVRVDAGPVISDGGWSFGVSWIDWDGDSYPDLFVANEDFSGSAAPNFLYHNNGDGTYTRVTEGPIAGDGGCLSSTWADFDNDGDLDCYAARPFINANLLYLNNGNGSFTKDTSSGLVKSRRFSMEVEWIDFDNDGWLDMFVANHGRPRNPMLASIYHHENGAFVLQKNSAMGLIEDEANGMAWGDCNGDGNRDILWNRNSKPSVLFINRGEGVFAADDESALGSDPGRYFGSWADFDNDGDLDIYTMSGDSGTVTLFRNNGNGEFESVSDPELSSDPGLWTAGYWGDCDNDGWLDLLVIGQDQYEAYPNRLYLNNGDGTFSRVKSGVIATDEEPSAAAAWADHDRDGDLDLFVANVNNANNTLYENAGNSNHWLQICPEGTRSNRSGIGATIRVKAVLSDSPAWQMREISAKNGFKAQSELPAHFGLGEATVADSVVVEWPSGAVQVLTGVEANQYLTIVETSEGGQ